MRLLACRELDLTTVRYECILPSKTNRDKCRTDIFKVTACPTDGIKAEVAEFWSKVESVLLLLVWTKRGTAIRKTGLCFTLANLQVLSVTVAAGLKQFLLGSIGHQIMKIEQRIS